MLRTETTELEPFVLLFLKKVTEYTSSSKGQLFPYALLYGEQCFVKMAALMKIEQAKQTYDWDFLVVHKGKWKSIWMELGKFLNTLNKMIDTCILQTSGFLKIL